MRELLLRLRRLFSRQEEWSEEIQAHLQMRAERNASAGMTAKDAEVLARRQFGNSSKVLEEVRAVHISAWAESVAQDTSYALRGFLKNPVFTAVVVLTLAIGIGATTAVFSVVDHLLFRGLPYAQQDRLVSFGLKGPIDPDEFMLGKFYFQFRSLLTPFASVTAISSPYHAALGQEDPVEVSCIPVQANLLSTLGTRVAAGRDFTAEDDRQDSVPVALISYNLWQSSFGGSTSILDHTVSIDDTPTRVIGVVPKYFEVPTLEAAEVLVPLRLSLAEQLRSNTGRFLRTFARLRAGISISQANQELQPFLSAVTPDIPLQVRKEVRLVVRPLADREFQSVRLASWVLFAAALCLFLLACANTGNLLLARAVARRTEFAVRASLGASRVRLLRQNLTESFLFGIFGGIAGSALAWFLFRLLGTLPPEGILRLRETTLDLPVLVATLVASLASVLLFGIAPGLPLSRAGQQVPSRYGGESRSILRSALITTQIAASIILVAGAALFARSLWRLETQTLGFDPSHVIAVSFDLNRHRYNTPQKQDAFYAALETKLQSMRQVENFAITDTVPPLAQEHERPFSNMAVLGKPPLPSEGGIVKFRYVTPGYFRTLKIRVLAGRQFTARDRTASQHSVILNEKLSRQLFGVADPINRWLVLSPDRPPFAVVGVVADVKNDSLASAAVPEYYVVRKQRNDFGVGASTIALFRTHMPPNQLAPWLRSGFAALDREMPLRIESMDDIISAENKKPRFLTVLIGLFAVFGLTLAAVGLYGVVSFLISQRTREIGVRMATGASPADIAKLVLRYAMVRAGIGTAVGLLVYLAVCRTARSLLFETSPLDAGALAAAVLILLSVAVIAALHPSSRAARIDPSSALRHD